jgi:FtsP/CotA-like multicopper oxidase with cupredoxin domain
MKNLEVIRSVSVLAGVISILVSSHVTAMGMGGCMMGCTSSTTVIDPPRGSAFSDPMVMPNVSTTPGVVEVNLEAKVAPVNINGKVANLQTYNGAYPAPTIKVKKGDLLKVHFKNSLPDTGLNMMNEPRSDTNLHTHGLHVSPMGNSDNIRVVT